MAKPGSVRIIAGQFRGRRLPIVDVAGLRPSGDRLRECLFSWLQPHIVGARCLDLFAGTGALGFEASSRGASYVQFVEKSLPAAQSLQKVKQDLRVDAVDISHQDGLTFTSPQPFDIIFLDPPFEQHSLSALLKLIEQAGLGHEQSWVSWEASSTTTLDTHWQVIKQKTIAGVQIALLKPPA